MIKGIVFDKDGTLMEYKPFWLPIAKAVIYDLLNRHVGSPKLSNALLDSVGADEGISGLMCCGTYTECAEKFNETLKSLGYTDVCITRDEVEQAYEEHINMGEIVPICDNIHQLMKDIKKRGIKIAVVTSDNSTMTKKCLESLGIYEFMDRLYTDDMRFPSKPDPYYMNRFCEEFGFSSNEVIMVGDTEVDMLFAKNSGALAVGVAKEPYNREVLLRYTDRVIHDISHIFEIIDER